MRFGDHIDVALLAFEPHPGKTYRTVKLRAGHKTVERITPPAGEDYGFDVDRYPLTVEVTVSPTGQSVRLHVNGHEIDLARLRAERKDTTDGR